MVIVCYCVLLSRPPLELITVQSWRRVEIPNLLASILQLDHAKVGYISSYVSPPIPGVDRNTSSWEHMFEECFLHLQDEDTVLTWASFSSWDYPVVNPGYSELLGDLCLKSPEPEGFTVQHGELSGAG